MQMRQEREMAAHPTASQGAHFQESFVSSCQWRGKEAEEEEEPKSRFRWEERQS